MADVEELREFLQSLNLLFTQIQHSLSRVRGVTHRNIRPGMRAPILFQVNK